MVNNPPKPKIIIAIDPGSPKDRDGFATTGIFVGEYSKLKMLETKAYIINKKTKEQDITMCVDYINDVIERYTKLGYECIGVIEAYINYGYNSAANTFVRNETSELIGAIKYGANRYGLSWLEQSTVDIKSRYSDKALVDRGLLVKEGRKYVFDPKVGDGEINRHIRDAFRHYLLKREKDGMLNSLRSLF